MVIKAIKWVMGRVLRLFPERLVGRLLPGELRFDPASRPPPPDAPQTRVRLYIAPVNYAGQGWYWARAAEMHLEGVGAVNMVAKMRADFSHRADNVVPIGFYAASGKWQRAQFETVAGHFTHMLVEAEKRPFGAVLDESVERQVRAILERGVKVAMVCHGSDIRAPRAHAARNPDSPFNGPMKPYLCRFEAVVRENKRVLQALGLPTFVSTPDLMIDVPSATWLPVVVDTDLWMTEAPVLERRRPLVVHAPSRAAAKGSELIDPVLHQLHDEGLIEYRRISKVPFSEMPKVYTDADIVLDQFLIGDYGVAACEAMAAGRVVIANVSDHARGVVRAESGMELPVIQSTPGSIENVLRSVLADRDHARRASIAGREFVAAVHDGRKSAEALSEFLA